MRFKQIAIFIIFIVFSTFVFSVDAESDYTRVCKYKDPNTNEEVFVHWSRNEVQNYDKVELKKKDGTLIGKVNLSGSNYSKNRKFSDGCGKYINYSQYGGYLFTDTPNLPGNMYDFKGIIVEGRDIYHSETYESEGSASTGITCKYTLTDGREIRVNVDSNGKITNNKEANIKNVYEFMNIIDKKFRCPATICYNKNIGTDEITFSDNVDEKCPWVIDGDTNDENDRRNQLTTMFAGPITKAQELEAKVIEEEYKSKLDDYTACLTTVDRNQNKCSVELSSMQSKCESGIDADCLTEKTLYKQCIENNYLPSEIDVKCSDIRQDYERAIDRAEDFENRTGISISKIMGYDGSFGIRFRYTNPDCSEIFGDKLLEWLDDFYFLIQVGAVVFTVVTGMMGYASAVMSSDDDAMKKATKKLKTRLTITVILLLLPVIIEFVLGLVEIPGLTNKNPLCK